MFGYRPNPHLTLHIWQALTRRDGPRLVATLYMSCDTMAEEQSSLELGCLLCVRLIASYDVHAPRCFQIGFRFRKADPSHGTGSTLSSTTRLRSKGLRPSSPEVDFLKEHSLRRPMYLHVLSDNDTAHGSSRDVSFHGEWSCPSGPEDSLEGLNAAFQLQ